MQEYRFVDDTSQSTGCIDSATIISPIATARRQGVYRIQQLSSGILGLEWFDICVGKR